MAVPSLMYNMNHMQQKPIFKQQLDTFLADLPEPALATLSVQCKCRE